MDLGFETPINPSDLAPATILVLVLAMAVLHFLKSMVEGKVRQYMDVERRNYEMTFEALRHRHERAVLGYEMWLNRVFDANTQVFAAVSKLTLAIRTLADEHARISAWERVDLEHHVVSTYGDSDELRRILTFWHTNRARTLVELDTYLSPIRMERARQAARALEDVVSSNELFLSEPVIDAVEELVRHSRAWAGGADPVLEDGTRAVEWMSGRQRELRREINARLSDPNAGTRREAAQAPPPHRWRGMFAQRNGEGRGSPVTPAP